MGNINRGGTSHDILSMKIVISNMIGASQACLNQAAGFVINWVTTLLEPVLSVFVSAFVIMTGGLLTWRAQRWWTKPVLETGDSGIIPWRPHNLGNTDVYRASIENTGRRAANNCKAQIFTEFTTDTSRYEIEATLPWAGGEGVHTTINPNEVSYFHLLTHDSTNDMLSVPSRDSLDEEGLILQYPLDDQDASPIISTKISPQQISEGDVERLVLKVTSENCSSISREFTVGSDGIPELVEPEDG